MGLLIGLARKAPGPAPLQSHLPDLITSEKVEYPRVMAGREIWSVRVRGFLGSACSCGSVSDAGVPKSTRLTMVLPLPASLSFGRILTPTRKPRTALVCRPQSAESKTKSRVSSFVMDIVKGFFGSFGSRRKSL